MQQVGQGRRAPAHHTPAPPRTPGSCRHRHAPGSGYCRRPVGSCDHFGARQRPAAAEKPPGGGCVWATHMRVSGRAHAKEKEAEREQRRGGGEASPQAQSEPLHGQQAVCAGMLQLHSCRQSRSQLGRGTSRWTYTLDGMKCGIRYHLWSKARWGSHHPPRPWVMARGRWQHTTTGLSCCEDRGPQPAERGTGEP